MPRGSEPAASNPISTEQIRRRVRLMVQISARPGVYRRGLVKTAERVTPQEAVVTLCEMLEKAGKIPLLRE